MGREVNPKLYRELSTPIPHEDALRNMEEFAQGIKSLREKCRIQNVACIMQVVSIDSADSSEENYTAASVCMGSQVEYTTLAATLYGSLQSELTEDLARAATAGRKRKA